MDFSNCYRNCSRLYITYCNLHCADNKTNLKALPSNPEARNTGKFKDFVLGLILGFLFFFFFETVYAGPAQADLQSAFVVDGLNAHPQVDECRAPKCVLPFSQLMKGS